MYEKAVNQKNKNPDLKILLAIGGWTHGVKPFSALKYIYMLVFMSKF
jgi:GH18 family chitinase